MAQTWDVDFSLALHNRTGKYFIGRDILAAAEGLIAGTRYGRIVRAGLPSGLRAKGIARLGGVETRLRMRWPALPWALRPDRPVLHLDPQTAALYRMAAEDMVLCHDMGPVTHPELFAPQVVALYRVAYRAIARSGPRMVFVSQASREAYVAEYGQTGEMTVIYPPLRADLSDAAPVPVEGVTGPFLLTVGSIGARKNQGAAIRAFAQSGLADRGVSYVLCGAREPGAEAVVAAAERMPGVRVLSYVSDGALAWLYAQAAGFVLTSRLEGFGVPVAEAIANGLIPVLSAAGVLEEVAGPGALTVEPSDVGAIARAMCALFEMPDAERDRRRAQLGRSIERFTPDRFAAGWRRVLGGSAGAG